MKNSNLILLLGLCILALCTSCNSEDENPGKLPIPLFSAEHLPAIHGESERSWRITGLINKYYNPNYHLEIDFDCLEDDIYTFKALDLSVQIDLGEQKCFGSNDDGVFTADIEIFAAELMMLDTDDGESIYLQFSRGYMNSDQTAQGVSLRWYALAELSENRMVFHRAGGQFIGEYNEALIFESVN